jgi:hypothetical protein
VNDWFKRILRRGAPLRGDAASVSSAEAEDADVAIYIRGEGTSIQFPAEGLTTSANVTQLSDRLYRLESVPLLSEAASFRDIIEADRLPDGKLRFCRIAQRSGWRTFSFLLSKEGSDNENIRRVLVKVDDAGGHWERVFGGFLLICLPPNVGWNPTREVLRAASTAERPTGIKAGLSRKSRSGS